jgi:Rrf2 family transcriptional regulator, iron-sulfur cluster assembly transcription factor
MPDWSLTMRLEISRKTDLAVRTLCRLKGNTRMKGSDLAALVDATPGFMAHVMAPLVHAGWVVSEPGPLGGYVLRAKLDEISLLAVIEAVEGPTIDGRCVLRGGPCPTVENCALHDSWVPARDALLQRLAATPIDQVAGSLTVESA